MLKIIADSWGWIGIQPIKIFSENDFGNLIIEDIEGQYWRLCPEELSCTIIAKNLAELELIMKSNDFQSDWKMDTLVELANEKLGALTENRKYCLKIPGLLGGSYDADNLSIITLLELIQFSGNVANQIKDLPDGTKIQFKISD